MVDRIVLSSLESVILANSSVFLVDRIVLSSLESVTVQCGSPASLVDRIVLSSLESVAVVVLRLPRWIG